MIRLKLWCLALLAVLGASALAACDAGGITVGTSTPPVQAPSATAAQTTLAPAANTASLPTAAPALSGKPSATAVRQAHKPRPSVTQQVVSGYVPEATPAGTFVVPSAKQLIATEGPDSNSLAITRPPDVASELLTYFKDFYAARSLERGGSFDVGQVEYITDEPYQQYTLKLLNKDQADADAGNLLEVSYSNISAKLEEWKPNAGGKTGIALVTATRTKRETRKGAAPVTTTDSVRFRMERRVYDIGPLWFAIDAYNSTTKKWVSETLAPQPDNVDAEVQKFFESFYEARSLTVDHEIDFLETENITFGAYRDYTLDLLNTQEDEVEAGKLTGVTYTGIKTEVVNWDKKATIHGGLAMVKVTRTSNVARPTGNEAPQTATYQFRVHRHTADDGTPKWLAVDFLSPATGKWVSESAGLSSPIPPSGHG